MISQQNENLLDWRSLFIFVNILITMPWDPLFDLPEGCFTSFAGKFNLEDEMNKKLKDRLNVCGTIIFLLF